jgi:CBS domain-containing protein
MERQPTQRIKDVMTRDIETVAVDATLQEAARKMTAADVGPLPVLEGGRVVGMCTDRDIIAWVASAGGDTRSTTVRDIMTTEVDACSEDDDVREVARTMQEQQHKRLVVLDRNQQLVGIVSLADLPVSGV